MCLSIEFYLPGLFVGGINENFLACVIGYLLGGQIQGFLAR